MDTRDIIKATDSTKRLVQDESFYKYIFKKTEKIVSVVFYVSNTLETDTRTTVLLEDILASARSVHNTILSALETRAHVAEEPIRATAHALISLNSKLRVAATTGLLSPEVLNVLSGEIDGVLRGLNKYLSQTTAFDDFDYSVGTTERTSTPRKETPSKQTASSEPSLSSTSDATDRRERIKVILSAKGEASIKDIADIITDISSKTIQREINSMIEDNIVKRRGERRWSKYSLV